MQLNTMQLNTMQLNTMQLNTMQLNTMQLTNSQAQCSCAVRVVSQLAQLMGYILNRLGHSLFKDRF